MRAVWPWSHFADVAARQRGGRSRAGSIGLPCLRISKWSCTLSASVEPISAIFWPRRTAYAHNQTLLVKEDQAVRRGQKIAEMGSSDADRVKLHFEIRRQGKPIDPAKLLPAR